MNSRLAHLVKDAAGLTFYMDRGNAVFVIDDLDVVPGDLAPPAGF